MEKFTLYLGLNDKDRKQQLISTLEAYKIANNILLHYTDGATVFEANGIYKHDSGEYTIEKTLRIELLFINTDVVNKIVNDLKKAFNQETITVQKQKIDSYLL